MSHGTTGGDYTVAARHIDAHLRYFMPPREEGTFNGEPVYSDRAQIRVANYRGGERYRTVYSVKTHTPKYTGLVVQGDSESEGTGQDLSFKVILRAASTEQVKVEYATSDGTATAEGDYTTVNGEVTFEPGDTMHMVSGPVLPDEVPEGDETVTLTQFEPDRRNDRSRNRDRG